MDPDEMTEDMLRVVIEGLARDMTELVEPRVNDRRQAIASLRYRMGEAHTLRCDRGNGRAAATANPSQGPAD